MSLDKSWLVLHVHKDGKVVYKCRGGRMSVDCPRRKVASRSLRLAALHGMIGVFSVLLWLAVLSLVPLSLAVLVGSIDSLAVSVGGRIVFGEALTLRRTGCISLIAVGVALVGWG